MTSYGGVIMTSSSLYLQCFSRCSRRWRRDSPGRRQRCRAAQDGAVAGRAGVTAADDEEKGEHEDQLIVVKVSDVIDRPPRASLTPPRRTDIKDLT